MEGQKTLQRCKNNGDIGSEFYNFFMSVTIMLGARKPIE
jgi:hypothetical protein